MRTWQAVGLAAIVLVILVGAFVIPVRTESPPSQSPVTRPSPSASTAPSATTAPTTAVRSLRSIEVCEVNPILDRENRTATLAVELIASALGQTIL